MKKYILLAFIVPVFLNACTEQPIAIDFGNELTTDSTYVTNPEQPQEKLYFLEELTGIRCTNCPEAAEALELLNEQNGNIFIIAAHHFGALTTPINGKSIQDFRTDDGRQLQDLIFGGQGNKPAVSFNRLPLSNQQNQFFVEGSGNWASAINQMKSESNINPMNLYVSSTFNPAGNHYDIEMEIRFTESLSEPLALNLFLTENNIEDAFVSTEEFITYNHVFRKSITHPSGKVFLDDLEVKEAGRVYIYKTVLDIDEHDEKQKFWKEENMEIIAFVSKSTPEDKRVYQVTKTDLK